MQTPKLEIGTTMAILPFVLGGMIYGGTKLSHTYISLDTFSGITIFLSLIVWVLAALSFTLILTLVIQAIKLIGNFKTGFWASTATLMQEVSAWLILYWMLLWGLPFTVAMSVFAYLSFYFNDLISGALGLFVGIFFLFLIRKVLPDEIWKASKKFNPERRLGWKKGLILTLILIAAGSSYLNSCYIFEASISSTEFKTTDQIELRAKMTGKVFNQNSLRAKMVSINSGDAATQPLAFDDELNGNFVTWIDLDKITPGKYRIIIFLKENDTESIYKKFFFWKNPNKFRKSFIVRIEKPMGAIK